MEAPGGGVVGSPIAWAGGPASTCRAEGGQTAARPEHRKAVEGSLAWLPVFSVRLPDNEHI